MSPSTTGNWWQACSFTIWLRKEKAIVHQGRRARWAEEIGWLRGKFDEIPCAKGTGKGRFGEKVWRFSEGFGGFSPKYHARHPGFPERY
jgi:hypothetical protein